MQVGEKADRMGQAKATLGGSMDARRRAVASRARLYGMGHSHPVLASRTALELAAIEFEACDLFPGLHGLIVRINGFRGWTVPALRIDGRRIQGSLAIARELDRLAPQVELFPRDPH